MVPMDKMETMAGTSRHLRQSCANGGNTFNIGDSNSNGFLEASEVVMNVDICNGAEGPQGPQGPAGNDGADGQDGARAARATRTCRK